MDGKTKIVSRGGKMTMRYRSMAKMGPEITGVKRCCNIGSGGISCGYPPPGKIV